MEARQRQIRDWLTRIRTRQILLPRFQRHEAWGSNEVANFLTSIVRQLPVGSLLVLGVSGEKLPFISREMTGAPKEGETVNELLLDGQQRLTALWRSLNDNYPDKTYLIKINDQDDEKTEVVAISRWFRKGSKFPLWVDNPVECWNRNFIPLKLLNTENESEYSEWADIASENDLARARKIEHLISPFRGNLSAYNLPFLYLPSNTPPETAIDVFIKLNTTFVRLSTFDIIVAQLEAATGEPLHDLVSSLNSSVPEIDSYAVPSNLVLAVSALLQDKLPNQRGYQSLDLEQFVQDWPKIVMGMKELVDFFNGEKIIDGPRLPTESVLAPLIALWSEVPKKPDKIGNIRILLRKYMWRSFFTERYDRAVPTAILQDYRALKKVIFSNARENEVPCFSEAEYPLPNKELLLQSRWPKYRDRLGRAILLLSLRGGSEDIADGSKISRQNITKREYHHVYPVAWINDNCPDQEAYRALNCVLITWRTNRTISAKEPVKYLLERSEASVLGKREIRRRLKTHFIDYKLLENNDYKDFLEKRAIKCIPAIRKLCEGISWVP